MSARGLCLASLLAGCSGNHPGFPNGVPDAPGDTLSSMTGDAAPDAVTLTVTAHGAAVPGVAVYFQTSDSSLVLAATTDEHGTAGAVLPPGGYVTVIEPDDGTGIARLATIAATQPRDALHLDLAPTGPTDAATFAATVPTLSGAAYYRLFTSCGQLVANASGAASGELLGCGDAADVVVIAGDQNGVILGSLYAADVPVAREPAALTGTYSALVATQFAYAGVPAASDAVTTYQAIETARGRLFDTATSGSVVAGLASTTLDLPATTGAIGLTISSAQPAVTAVSEQRVFDWGPWRSSYTLDLASAMLPAFAGVPTYDPATRSISWSEQGAGTPPDLVRARVHVYRDAIPEGRSWTWAIVAPRGAAASVALPRLPAGGFDFNPGATDTIDVDDLLSASVPRGYDAVRTHGFDDIQTFVAGPSGRIVAETLYTPPL